MIIQRVISSLRVHAASHYSVKPMYSFSMEIVNNAQRNGEKHDVESTGFICTAWIFSIEFEEVPTGSFSLLLFIFRVLIN